MKTLLAILHLSIDFLKKQGVENPRRQAQDLMGDALNLSRTELYLQHDRPLLEEELALLRERLARHAKGEPLAYIHGKVKFYDCSLLINPHVLIPRQETEILVDKIIHAIEKEENHHKVLWDLCCGSGCIGIAIKKKLPHLTVVLSDLSSEALKVAAQNAQRNGVEVECVQGDLLAPFEGKKAHYITCNPPYISNEEYKIVDQSVRNYEPSLALVAGPTGMELYERLAKELLAVLHPQGKVYFEIGRTQGLAISNCYKGAPWSKQELQKDWAQQDRFFFLEIE